MQLARLLHNLDVTCQLWNSDARSYFFRKVYTEGKLQSSLLLFSYRFSVRPRDPKTPAYLNSQGRYHSNL